jgi:prophage regulatory protein
MKPRDQDPLSVLSKAEKARAKTERLLNQRHRVQPAASTVDLAAVRASVRKAVVDAEVEKQVAAQAAPDRLLRVKEVEKVAGLHRSSIWRLERQGDFPKRVQLTKKTVAWRASDVAAWIERRGRADR